MKFHFQLIVAKGSRQGMEIPVNVDLFLLGSEKICQLRARNLAPKHCALITRDHKVFLRDFDSGQPTLVNNQVVPPESDWPLHSGDHIALGNLEFTIQMRERSLAKEDLEEWGAIYLDEQRDKNVLEDTDDDTHEVASAAEAASVLINRLNTMKGMVKGRLRIGREEGIVSVRFNDVRLVDAGEITQIKKELIENLSQPTLRVLLDFKNVRRLSSIATSMLTDFHRFLHAKGSTLAMCRIRPELREMLTRFLGNEIPIFADKKAAYAARW